MDPMTTEPKLTTDRWGIPEPIVPVIPKEQVLDFLQNAPGGSLIEIYDDIYQKGYSTSKNIWLHLNEVMDYEYHESTPEQLASNSVYCPVYLVRFGEGNYSKHNAAEREARLRSEGNS